MGLDLRDGNGKRTGLRVIKHEREKDGDGRGGGGI